MKRFFTRCPAVLGLILLLATACQTEIERGETAVSPHQLLPPSPYPQTQPQPNPPSRHNQSPQPKQPSRLLPRPSSLPTSTTFRLLSSTPWQISPASPAIIIDLQTGEQISLNPDVALAGTSLIKIPLLVETFRALDRPPDIEQTKLLTQTTSVSSNFAANLLLRDVVGGGDIFSGADALTQSMRNLGLYNTFIAVPYNLEPPPGRQQTYLTPANQRTDLSTRPDPYRQTTLGDLARLLTEIYSCAQSSSGLLREVYPEQIMQNECQEILRLLELNELARLLQNGLPENVTFSHKVGWIDDTHGNIGIVFGPERPYLIGMALYAPGWLEWEESAPLFESCLPPDI
ncbi:MAG: class A beta-lactamase-related serine hydrolase [Chloroflexi bacterium]|nr:class A beta-lactamase-related serine hydrolase [Chloroflexota bacterium]